MSFIPREPLHGDWTYSETSSPIWRATSDTGSGILQPNPVAAGVYLGPEPNNDGPGALVESHLDHIYEATIAAAFEENLSAIELCLVKIAQDCQKRQQSSLQCYEHGCNGRAFSCLENFRRHIREQSGNGRVACAFCLRLFTRKSNWAKHIREGKCKALRESEAGDSESSPRPMSSVSP